jgi:hypothetical protein
MLLQQLFTALSSSRKVKLLQQLLQLCNALTAALYSSVMLLQQLFTALTALTAAQLHTNFEFDAKDQVQKLVNHKLLHLVFCKFTQLFNGFLELVGRRKRKVAKKAVEEVNRKTSLVSEIKMCQCWALKILKVNRQNFIQNIFQMLFMPAACSQEVRGEVQEF